MKGERTTVVPEAVQECPLEDRGDLFAMGYNACREKMLADKAELQSVEATRLDGYTPVKTETLEWLLGERGEFEPPTWQRDEHQRTYGRVGEFWWRTHLRQAMLTRSHQPPAVDDQELKAQGIVEWARQYGADDGSHVRVLRNAYNYADRLRAQQQGGGPEQAPAPAVDKRIMPERCEIGIFGKAYDGPDKCRAYTYAHQPANSEARKLGTCVRAAGDDPAGDHIDRGLALLRHLSAHGFGVFELIDSDEGVNAARLRAQQQGGE